MGRKRGTQTVHENYNKVFPKRLRGLLDDTRTTQAAVAAHLGITRQSVAAYCSGESTPSWEGIAAIAQFFGCSSDYLLGLSEFQDRETEKATLSGLGISEGATSCMVSYFTNPFMGEEALANRRKMFDSITNGYELWGILDGITSIKEQVSHLIEYETGQFYKSDPGSRLLSWSLNAPDYMDKPELFQLWSAPEEYLDYSIEKLGRQFVELVRRATDYNKLEKLLDRIDSIYLGEGKEADTNGIHTQEDHEDG